MKEPMVPLRVAMKLVHAMEEVIDWDEKATERLKEIGITADTSLVDLMRQALLDFEPYRDDKK